MTKERLKQYRDLAQEINELDERIKRLRARSEGGNIVMTNMRRNGVPTDHKVKLADAVRLMERLSVNILCEMVAVQEFINNIDNSKVRRIFELRYIDALRWKDVSKKMILDERYLRRLHDKTLVALDERI